MPYLGGYAYQGGPGGWLKKGFGLIGRTASSIIPGGSLLYDTASTLIRRYGPGGTPPTMPAGTMGGTSAPAPSMDVTSKGAPRGYRLNKTSYFLKDGTRVEAGTKWVKIRRRNPANARALRKSLSRVESFGGLVKRTRKSIRKVKSL